MSEPAWVEQVHAAEESWIALRNIDGDILVESLANLPEDAQGRLEPVACLHRSAAVACRHCRLN